MKTSIFIGAGAAVFLLAQAAFAHVVVEPRESAAGEVVTYTVRIPSHLEATTIAVEVEIPAGVEIVAIADTPEGHKVSKTATGATVVRWSTKIPADERGAVTFAARNPAAVSELSWKTHQLYDNGVTVEWIEPKGGKEPAPITKVIEAR